MLRDRALLLNPCWGNIIAITSVHKKVWLLQKKRPKVLQEAPQWLPHSSKGLRQLGKGTQDSGNYPKEKRLQFLEMPELRHGQILQWLGMMCSSGGWAEWDPYWACYPRVGTGSYIQQHPLQEVLPCWGSSSLSRSTARIIWIQCNHHHRAVHPKWHIPLPRGLWSSHARNLWRMHEDKTYDPKGLNKLRHL